MKVIGRLGRTPAERGDTTSTTGSPDILTLSDGAFTVIGVDITEELGPDPWKDARCAPNERIVRVTRTTLIAAKNDIPDE
ncbi:hypothetical protein [Actinomadura livida]|uniref:Uncharacterized protein n=1 Tax=Actinomadura livida TaxID=79909 RepID=A0A7W7IKL7_9ACTN|nr:MULTISPECIES: hypothetical protein [Actinomadura]MBB4778847.1 hypothetical protein [Actinomadura catellatispora]GGU26217.1 hypothetical protein GCM10010208_58690 [Actinomadura livida]